MFQTNIRGWHLGQAFLLMLSLGVLFVALRRLGLNSILALLLVLLFGSSPPIVIQLSWAIDPTTALASLAVLVLIMLNRPSGKPIWFISLALLLLVSPFLKEIGLAIIGAVALYAVESARSKQQSLRQAGSVLRICILVTAIYFGIRQSVVGGIPSSIANSSGFLFNFYSGTELTLVALKAKLLTIENARKTGALWRQKFSGFCNAQ